MRDVSGAAIGAAAMRWFCAIATTMLLGTTAKAEWKEPWKENERAIVIDAYEFNPINWKELVSDKRVAGFINKASDGLPPDWSCKGREGDELNLCKNRWWKYSVTQELYLTRREMAKTLGLEWGAYHLGRPGNPREQADHFIDFAQPADDELIALDIEDNTDEWMSLADAEIFANQIKIRVGRYPVLYTNGSTATFISQHKDEYPLLSRLPLWYARYRDDITTVFPTDTWPTYALWQFSSMHNCGAKSCPYRVKGARADIDVNVSPLGVAELRAAWPFSELVGADASVAVADATDTGSTPVLRETARAVASVAGGGAAVSDTAAVASPLVAAYGEEPRARPVDPLELLNQASLEVKRAPKPVAAEVASKPAERPRAKATRPTPVLDAVRTPGPSKIVAPPALRGALDSMRNEMGRVRAILTAQAARAPMQPAAALTGHATAGPKATRSRIAAAIRAAAERTKPLMPELVLRTADIVAVTPVTDASGLRGPRLLALAGRNNTSAVGDVASIERRVSRAFITTR